MSRQDNSPYELELLNGWLETGMEEQAMNQSGWTMHRFDKRTMYIHRFYPTGGSYGELPFICNLKKNLKE